MGYRVRLSKGLERKLSDRALASLARALGSTLNAGEKEKGDRGGGGVARILACVSWQLQVWCRKGLGPRMMAEYAHLKMSCLPPDSNIRFGAAISESPSVCAGACQTDHGSPQVNSYHLDLSGESSPQSVSHNNNNMMKPQ